MLRTQHADSPLPGLQRQGCCLGDPSRSAIQEVRQRLLGGQRPRIVRSQTLAPKIRSDPEVPLCLGNVAELEEGFAEGQPQGCLHLRPAGELRVPLDLPRRLAQQLFDRHLLVAGVGVGVGHRAVAVGRLFGQGLQADSLEPMASRAPRRAAVPAAQPRPAATAHASRIPRPAARLFSPPTWSMPRRTVRRQSDRLAGQAHRTGGFGRCSCCLHRIVAQERRRVLDVFPIPPTPPSAGSVQIQAYSSGPRFDSRPRDACSIRRATNGGHGCACPSHPSTTHHRSNRIITRSRATATDAHRQSSSAARASLSVSKLLVRLPFDPVILRDHHGATADR